LLLAIDVQLLKMKTKNCYQLFVRVRIDENCRKIAEFRSSLSDAPL